MADSRPKDSFLSIERNESFFRLCKLLIGGGTEVMRMQFDQQIPPFELPKKLQQMKSHLLNLKRVITPSMQKKLYPDDNIYGKSTDFDISLLMILMRNLCGLKPPKSTNNWEDMPLDYDLSSEADILRLKQYRNKLFAHVHSCHIETSEFKTISNEITTILVRLGGPDWEFKAEKMLKEPLSQLEIEHKTELEMWHNNDAEVKEIVTEMKEDVGNIREGIEKIFEHVQSGTGIYFISHIFVTISSRLFYFTAGSRNTPRNVFY